MMEPVFTLLHCPICNERLAAAPQPDESGNWFFLMPGIAIWRIPHTSVVAHCSASWGTRLRSLRTRQFGPRTVTGCIWSALSHPHTQTETEDRMERLSFDEYDLARQHHQKLLLEARNARLAKQATADQHADRVAHVWRWLGSASSAIHRQARAGVQRLKPRLARVRGLLAAPQVMSAIPDGENDD
jgi:hypothetical protein